MLKLKIKLIWRHFGLWLFMAILLSSVWMAYSSFKMTLLVDAQSFDARIEYLISDLPEDVLDARKSGSWSTHGKLIPLLAKKQERWLRIEFANHSPFSNQAHIVVNNPMVDLLDFFEIDSNGQVVGRRFIGDHRQLEWSSEYSMPSYSVTLDPLEQKSVYIKAIVSRNFSLPIQIYSIDQLREYKEFQLLLWGAFLGLSLIMILYYLSLFRAMRESVYLAYVTFTSVTLIYISLLYGFGYHIFPMSFQTVVADYAGSVSLLLMQSILLFTRNFMAIEGRKSKSMKGYGVSVFFGLLLIVSIISPQRWVVLFAFSLQPFLFVYLSILIIRAFKTRQYWAQFYLISWIPVFIGMPITTFSHLGYLEAGLLVRYAFFFSIIAQLSLTAWSFSERMKLTEQRRIYQTTHDRYTGLANRSALTQALNRWMNQQQPFSLVFIEVRNFLRFLPYVGAERAAIFISEVARIVNQYWYRNKAGWAQVKTVNFIPPYLVRDHVLAIIVDSDKAQQCLEDIYKLCDRDITIAEIEISVNPVLATASFPEHSEHADDLIQKAMQALDYAKNEGLPFASYMEERVQYSEQEVKIATDLRKAIQLDELELYHQPQIYLKDFTLYGSEVLLRWIHPELGFIPPDVFVKVAEDIGMIEDLTQWVVERALMQQRKLNDLGFKHKVSINISGKDVNSDRFFSNVKKLLEKYQIKGEQITLELTESVTVKDKSALQELMSQFKEIDVHFSIDDFGTGFSSLEALSELNFTELKIDRSFVQGMMDSERNFTIASTTIELANRLHLDTVAEGVENEKVLFTLKNSDCKIAQGYYFSKPLPIDEYVSWIKQGLYL